MMKFNSKEINVWFIADTHYWHNNIVKGITKWNNPDENCRNFNSVQEMSRHLIEQINKYVNENDILFFLGDWSFGGINNIWNFRKQLNVEIIHFILGNHDHHIENNKILPNCTKVHHGNNNYSYKDYEENDDKYPKTREESRASDIFFSYQKYLEIEIDKKMICLMHYPIEDWNNRPKNSVHLHGHVHGKLNDFQPKGRLDVGIDSAYKIFGEYKPFSWNEIKKIFHNYSLDLK